MSDERKFKAGDIVLPIPEYNETTCKEMRVRNTCRVIEAKRDPICSSGLMLLVEKEAGGEIWLDSKWFQNLTDTDEMLARANRASRINWFAFGDKPYTREELQRG